MSSIPQRNDNGLSRKDAAEQTHTQSITPPEQTDKTAEIKQVPGGRRYMAGLDGLRALAVLGVVFYHLDFGWARGGFLGVAVFFVLSGYLITDLLAAEWRENGRLNLKGFWLRRLRRLAPALIALLAAAAVWTAAFDRSGLASLAGNALSALLYVNNWWLIYHRVSYFESFGAPSPLGHLWSLSVEEQFYLLWPFLLPAGFRFMRRRGRLFIAIAALAAVSALAMGCLYQSGEDPSRVYYGTDTRAFGLLIGSALAVLWPSRRLTADVSEKERFAIDFVGGTGLLAVLLMMWRTDEYNEFLYRGGFAALSVCSAAAVAAIAHPSSRLGKLLSLKPLRWIGERSYGIYLWHYFIIAATSPSVNTHGVNAVRSLGQIAASFALAAVSYRYVERPIRDKLWRRGPVRLNWPRIAFSGSRLALTCAACLTMISLVGAACKGYTAPADSIGTSVHTQSGTADGSSAQPEGGRANPAGDHPLPGIGTGPDTSARSDGPGGLVREPGSGSKPDGGKPPSGGSDRVSDKTGGEGKGVTAIGDSVLLGVAGQLEKILPGIVIDGKVGRQLSQAADELEQLKADGKLGKRVIIELGTNGLFSKKQLDKLLDALKEADQVLLVNTRVPRKWEADVNKALEAAAANYPNTTLVDWYTASADHDSYFTRDGVHLQTKGAKIYAAMLADALTRQR